MVTNEHTDSVDFSTKLQVHTRVALQSQSALKKSMALVTVRAYPFLAGCASLQVANAISRDNH